MENILNCQVLNPNRGRSQIPKFTESTTKKSKSKLTDLKLKWSKCKQLPKFIMGIEKLFKLQINQNSIYLIRKALY